MASNLENFKLDKLFIQDSKTKSDIESAFKVIVEIIGEVKSQLNNQINLSNTSLNAKIDSIYPILNNVASSIPKDDYKALYAELEGTVHELRNEIKLIEPKFTDIETKIENPFVLEGESVVNVINELGDNAPKIDASHIKNLPLNNPSTIITGGGISQVYHDGTITGSGTQGSLLSIATALSSYVPITGLGSDVNFGNHTLTINGMKISADSKYVTFEETTTASSDMGIKLKGTYPQFNWVKPDNNIQWKFYANTSANQLYFENTQSGTNPLTIDATRAYITELWVGPLFTGNAVITNAGAIYGTSFIKTGGAATDVLRADGTTTTGLSGTKVYYVSDTSGGAVTRKLTFVNGLLTSET